MLVDIMQMSKVNSYKFNHINSRDTNLYIQKRN